MLTQWASLRSRPVFPFVYLGNTKKVKVRITLSHIRSDICSSGKRYYMNLKAKFFDPKDGNSVGDRLEQAVSTVVRRRPRIRIGQDRSKGRRPI